MSHGDWTNQTDDGRDIDEVLAERRAEREAKDEPLWKLRVFRTGHIEVVGCLIFGMSEDGNMTALATCPDVQTARMVGEAVARFHQVPMVMAE